MAVSAMASLSILAQAHGRFYVMCAECRMATMVDSVEAERELVRQHTATCI